VTQISRDGRAFAVASWGDGIAAPTINVFQTNQNNGPMYPKLVVRDVLDSMAAV
jgi:hypothetical protein